MNELVKYVGIALLIGAGCAARGRPDPDRVTPTWKHERTPRPPPAFARDTDGDGLVDSRDKCPRRPEDCDGFEDSDGCPDLDNDGDRIPDTCDLCPDEPETYNASYDKDGCPDKSDHSFMGHPQFEYAAPIAWFTFAPGKVRLPPSMGQAVRATAGSLNRSPEYQQVAVIGMAGVRERDPNRLSLARARAVRKALIGHGVNPARLLAFGIGTRLLRRSDYRRTGKSKGEPRVYLLTLRARKQTLYAYRKGQFVWVGPIYKPRPPHPPKHPDCAKGRPPRPAPPPPGGCKPRPRPR